MFTGIWNFAIFVLHVRYKWELPTKSWTTEKEKNSITMLLFLKGWGIFDHSAFINSLRNVLLWKYFIIVLHLLKD